MSAFILSIEDDVHIQELIRYNLSSKGYRVHVEAEAQNGIDFAVKHKPDMILLDVMLPGLGMDGIEVCRKLRNKKATKNIPIIMLTAKSEENDILLGLGTGADDYVSKPFSPRVLVAKIQILLRRHSAERIRIADVHIDLKRSIVRRDSQTIPLSHTEFAILKFLAQHSEWAHSRTNIIDSVAGNDYFISERTIDVHICGLRKKLGQGIIETVRGIGYRIQSE